MTNPMNTHARLNEEQKKQFSLPNVLLGCIFGVIAGFGAGILSGDNTFSPQIAYTILAFGLGGVAVLVLFLIRGYRIVDRDGREIDQR